MCSFIFKIFIYCHMFTLFHVDFMEMSRLSSGKVQKCWEATLRTWLSSGGSRVWLQNYN